MVLIFSLVSASFLFADQVELAAKMQTTKTLRELDLKTKADVAAYLEMSLDDFNTLLDGTSDSEFEAFLDVASNVIFEQFTTIFSAYVAASSQLGREYQHLVEISKRVLTKWTGQRR
jgi:hypothetical protein